MNLILYEGSENRI